FFKVLNDQYYQIALNLEKGSPINEVDSRSMQTAYRRLYTHIMAIEGPSIWNELVAPLTGQEIKKKDVFDDLAELFAPQSANQMEGFWSGLMTGFLDLYVIQRVKEVMATTVRRAT